ncbi:MAG: response regulator transcription factor [Saprospiraceae bacterium]|nr:response regulator transcription factor [Saprospiraceae bacterium]
MKILIIEDEELAVRKLKKTLESIDANVEMVGSADSIASSVDWLTSNPAPDLILMDIELADGQSFEIFNRTKVSSPVIFTTSYDEYALKAFKVNSVDYLLKPVQKDELQAALDKFNEVRKVYNHPPEEHPGIKDLIAEMKQTISRKVYRKRFLVKHQHKLVSVEVKDISYFFSDDKLNFFKTFDDKKYLIDYTLDEIEQMVDPSDFFRINRGFLLAPSGIDQIQDYFGSRLKLVLKPSIDKESLVSREKVTDFKTWLGK